MFYLFGVSWLWFIFVAGCERIVVLLQYCDCVLVFGGLTLDFCLCLNCLTLWFFDSFGGFCLFGLLSFVLVTCEFGGFQVCLRWFGARGILFLFVDC